MKILKLDPIYRSWLTTRGAIGFDSDLNEKFIGLNHVDSVFYADVASEPLRLFELSAVDELTRFLNLHERHQLALDFHTAAWRYPDR